MRTLLLSAAALAEWRTATPESHGVDSTALAVHHLRCTNGALTFAALTLRSAGRIAAQFPQR